MKSNRATWIVIGSALALIASVILIIQLRGGYTWSETYAENREEEEKDPYGVYVLAELLRDYFPGEDFVELTESLDSINTTDVGSNYVFVGRTPYMRDEESDALLDFIANGNNAFIAAQYLPYALADSIWLQQCEIDTATYYGYLQFNWDTLIYANFEHPDLRLADPVPFQFLQKDSITWERDWAYLELDQLCDTVQQQLESLAYMNDDLICFSRTAYGDGYFYWYSLPSTLTNINLIEQKGIDFAARLFSHLEAGTIYWDIQRKDPMNAYSQQDQYYNDRRLSADHPLRYVLSQPPLAMAWYLLLGASLLFLIFRAKRRQRIIPVVAAKRNTSLAFVRNIGRMYFLQQNHRQLAIQQMQLFLNELREEYAIPITTLDETTVQRLAQKSGGDAEILTRIQTIYAAIEKAAQISDDRLIVFYQLLERFRDSKTDN
ncbi:MAG: DUF4350 domain-containing protein [Bacteroidota bacterium]